jgi:HEPN domain-containing protein
MRRNPQDEGQRWLSQAAEDLKWARHLAEEGGWNIACFLSQQVAEKALKAYLYAQGEEIVLGHSVARLCADAASYNAEFAEKARRWGLLDGLYIPTRYPNGLPDGIPAQVYDREAALSAVALAEEAVEYVQQTFAKITTSDEGDEEEAFS